MKPEIQLLDAHQVDADKWDACVKGSPNSLIYGLSNYLNYTTDNWKGIVVNDYEAVMPIPWRKKFGITYSYNVPFLQQAGIYSTTPDLLNVNEAIRFILSFCSYGSYCFNYRQQVASLIKRTNLILPLQLPYEELEKKFSSSTQSLIKEALDSGLKYVTAAIEESVGMYAAATKGILKISDSQFRNFMLLCHDLNRSGQVHARKIIDDRGDILSSILLLHFNNRIYNIINATTIKGRKNNSNYLLYHAVLKEFSDSSDIFDFEGSNHPGIAHFYRKFSAIEQAYFRFDFNELPFYIKWLRK